MQKFTARTILRYFRADFFNLRTRTKTTCRRSLTNATFSLSKNTPELFPWSQTRPRRRRMATSTTWPARTTPQQCSSIFKTEFWSRRLDLLLTQRRCSIIFQRLDCMYFCTPLSCSFNYFEPKLYHFYEEKIAFLVNFSSFYHKTNRFWTYFRQCLAGQFILFRDCCE